MNSYVQKFNPYNLSEETLGAIATGRERVLEDILSLIARNAEGGRVQHLQVVAPRGYGKSFLMRMVQSALKVRVAEGLPAVLALLPEEQHNVDAPHRLLNEIQRVLEGRPASSLLGGAFSESEEEWEQAVSALDATIASKLPEDRGIAVAIVENFDQLMADVFRKPRDQSRLRALLDRQGGRLMLLATATRRADADYEQRLFHATRMIELEPWKEDSCLAFFERLRGHRHAGPLSPQVQSKARALAQFIGGSPRMATVLAEVLEHNDSLRVAQMLDALVDELTPYYKHRIENLSRRARTLMDALLRMGEPRTQSELAAKLGTVQARIAEPFNELRAAGEVLGVKAQHSSEMLYRVSDRLMAHYYRKRHLSLGEGASMLDSIVEFLESYYTPEEKQAEAARLRAEGREADAAVFDRLALKAKDLLAGEQAGPGVESDWLDQLREQLIGLDEAGQFEESVKRCQEAVKQAEAFGDVRQISRSMRFLGLALVPINHHPEAEEVLHHALKLAEQGDDLREQAYSLSSIGWLLGQLGRYAEAEEVLRRSLPLAEQAGNFRGQVQSSYFLGRTLGKLGRHAEAEAVLRRALSLANQTGDLRDQAQTSYYLGWALREAGQFPEAEELLLRAASLEREIGRASGVAWVELEFLKMALALHDDAKAVTAWQRMHAAVVAAPHKKRQPDIRFWIDSAAAAALRSGQLGTLWPSLAALSTPKTYRRFSREIIAVRQTQGRAAAYALCAHLIEVLAENPIHHTTREGLAESAPIAFLGDTLSNLAHESTDPALLRDIVALLEQRLPSETVAARTLLEAVAQRLEKPDDPAALERVDPDLATMLNQIFGPLPEPTPKPPPPRARRGTGKRKKK